MNFPVGAEAQDCCCLKPMKVILGFWLCAVAGANDAGMPACGFHDDLGFGRTPAH